MSRLRIHRRTMLRGMLGGAAVGVSLPLLELFLDPPYSARAECVAFPKRFGTWFWGNGVLPERFRPTGTGPGFELSEQLAPLAPMHERGKISVVSGLRVMTPNTVPHGSGPAGFLGGADMYSPDGNASSGTFPGPSIDQIMANAIGDQTLLPSLEIGVQRADGSISWRGRNAMNTIESSPIELFGTLFGAGFRAPGDTSGPDPRLGLRQSVLDVVNDQVGRLRPRLGLSDRARLDAHLDAIRSIETRIARLQENPPSFEACMLPTMPEADYPDVMGRPDMDARSDVMADLLAMALACDQTRIFTVMYSQPVNNVLYTDRSAGHHQLTHDEPGDQPEVNEIVQGIMGRLNRFLERLDAVAEGDETLLDHSTVLCTSDVSFGRTHSLDEYPVVLAGGGCGSFKMGIHHVSPGENICRLSYSLLQSMDVPVSTFGEGPAQTDVGISEIEET